MPPRRPPAPPPRGPLPAPRLAPPPPRADLFFLMMSSRLMSILSVIVSCYVLNLVEVSTKEASDGVFVSKNAFDVNFSLLF